MKAERSSSACEHFYTNDIKLLHAQLDAVQKLARKTLCVAVDKKVDEAKLKKEMLRLKVRRRHI